MSPNRAPRILVVEDEPAVRRLVARALQEEGYEVVAVSDGQAGLDAVSRADALYDLVVTNNHMPRMGGAELIAELRSRFPGLPILHVDDLSQPLSAALPPDVPTLYKPFRIERLLEVVRERVRR
jgi:CheY-like chemotaxis protein